VISVIHTVYSILFAQSFKKLLLTFYSCFQSFYTYRLVEYAYTISRKDHWIDFLVQSETTNVKTEIGPISLRGTAWAMLELAARAQVNRVGEFF
jgi:hypothetical protein